MNELSCSVAEQEMTLAPMTAMLVVLPLPRVTAVVPAFGPSRGGTLITVHGTYFGSDGRPDPVHYPFHVR